MFAAISDKLIRVLVREDTIRKEEEELYQFGINQGLILIDNILTFFLIGWLFGMIWQTVVYLACFIPVRIYAGGYHAQTQRRCYVCSCIVVGGALALMKIGGGYAVVYAVLAVIACVLIWVLAPVQNGNKPLDALEIQVYRRRAHTAVCMESLLCAVSSLVSTELFICMCVALVTSGLAVLIGHYCNSK